MLIKSVPRELWQEVGPAIVLELAADFYRAARERRHPTAILRGLIDGLADRSDLLEQRKTALGRRRVGERFVRQAFAESEDDMGHCRWQRTLRTWTT